MEKLQMLAMIQAYTGVGIGLMIGLGALGACVGIGIMSGRFLEFQLSTVSHSGLLPFAVVY